MVAGTVSAIVSILRWVIVRLTAILSQDPVEVDRKPVNAGLKVQHLPEKKCATVAAYNAPAWLMLMPRTVFPVVHVDPPGQPTSRRLSRRS